MGKFFLSMLPCILSLTLAANVFAQEQKGDGPNYERFYLTTGVDTEGRISPDVFVPYYWNKALFSGIGFLKRERTDADSIDGFAESRNAVTVDENRVTMSMLSWQSRPAPFMYSMGGELEYVSIDKTEFGYFQMPAGLGSDWIAFDNEVDITIISPNLRGDLKYSSSSDMFKTRADFTISPVSTLSVDQETRIKPLVSQTGSSSGSTSQDLGYKAGLDILLNFFNDKRFPRIGITGSYEYLPMKYDLAVLDYDAATATYSFTESEIEIEETILFLGAKLIFDVQILHGMVSPAIGFGVESVKTTDKTGGTETSNTESNTLITFGFEKRF